MDVILYPINADCVVTQTEEGFLLNLKYAGTAADTICGNYLLRTAVRYTDPYGVTAVSNELDVPFSVVDDGFALEMKVDGPKYFVIRKLEKSDPIKLVFSADGAPLTKEQLENVKLLLGSDGLTCQTECLYDESAIAVRIVKDEQAKPGRYDFTFSATTEDQIGRTVSVQEEQKIELSTHPVWLRILVILLILALIALLIWLYLNMKVLPKQITLNHGQTVFIVDGNPVKGAAKFRYDPRNKKNGTISLTLPPYPDNSLVKGGFALNVTAVSPRRVKSARRRVLVTHISPVNTAALQNLSVTTHNLVKMDEGDGVVWLFDSKQVSGPSVATQFEIGGKPACSVVGETITGETFTMTAQMQFK